MAFYVGHGLEYQSDSDGSGDFADPDLDDDSEWEDPAGAFTRDTRVPIKLTAQPDKPAVPSQVQEALPSTSASPPQPQPKQQQRANSAAPKPAHVRLRQVAPKRSPPSSAQKATTNLYLAKHFADC